MGRLSLHNARWWFPSFDSSRYDLFGERATVVYD
jgi:hypothetical protein